MAKLKRKIIKTRWKTSVFTGKPIRIAYVKIYNEPVSVMGLKFRMDNIYEEVLDGTKGHKDLFEPIEDSNYNIHRRFNVYRKKMGFIQPSAIKRARKQLGLSQTDVAFILGMSVATVSKLENGEVVQSVHQDTEMRCLVNRPMLETLLTARLQTAKTRHNRSEYQHLRKCLKLVNSKGNNHVR